MDILSSFAYIVLLHPECQGYITTAALEIYYKSFFTPGVGAWSMLKIHINPLHARLIIYYRYFTLSVRAT